MSAGIIKPRRGRRRPTFGNPASAAARPAPIRVASAVWTANVLTLTFDGPVTLRGVPAFRAGAADQPAPSAAAMVGTTAVRLTYDAPFPALYVPFEDPAVRNPSGGFVNAGIVPNLQAAVTPAVTGGGGDVKLAA